MFGSVAGTVFFDDAASENILRHFLNDVAQFQRVGNSLIFRPWVSLPQYDSQNEIGLPQVTSESAASAHGVEAVLSDIAPP